MTTETTTTDTNSTDLIVPLTGDDGSCYLCDNEATHVGQMAVSPLAAEIGLCEGCYLREGTDRPTTVDPTGTRNHKKITYEDGSTCYTYETNNGYYSLTKCSVFGTWEEDGPFDLPNVHACGDTTVEDIPPTAIPAAAGNSIEITGVTVLPADENPEESFTATCPECGSQTEQPTENEAWAVAKRHNKSMHDEEPIAGVPQHQL